MDKLTSLIKGGSVGSAAVICLTGGYLWLQILGEGVDSSYTGLLALSLLLYFLGKEKRDAEPQRQIQTARLEQKKSAMSLQQPQFYQQPVATSVHGSPCYSHTPNITITVNGEKRGDCTEEEKETTRPEPQTPTAPIGKERPELCFYRIYKDKAGEYRWQLKTRALSDEGEVITEIIGTSHQGFKTPIVCLNEIYRVMECCHARIEEDIDGDGNSTVVVPRPFDGRRTMPYVDRTNLLKQELLADRFFKDRE